MLADETSAREWVEEARSRYDHPDAFQRATTALLAIENEPGDLAFLVGIRDVLRGHFERSFGVVLDGPPWRIDPCETDRPTRQEWDEQMKIFL